MSVCPWCEAAVRDTSAPCPKCGKLAALHASASQDVPDLIIPTRHSAPKTAAAPAPKATPAPAAKAAPPPPAASAQGGSGADNVFDDDDVFGSASVDLDLDLSKGPPMAIAESSSARAPSSAAVIDRPSLSKAPVSGGALAPPVSAPTPPPPSSAGEAPSSEMSAPAPPAVDPFEARALADYGPAPKQWWMTPLYAYRVKKREPELRRALAAKKEEAARAEAVAEDALMAFAERVRSPAEKNARYAPALHDLAQTEEVFRARDTALAGEMDAHKARQAQMDVTIADLEKQLAAAQSEEKVIVGELAEADALLKRAEAKAKRADIEIRNAMAQLEPKTPTVQSS